MNAAIVRERSFGGVPLPQNLVVLGGCQQRQLREPSIRGVNDPFKQHLEVRGHPLDRRGVGQVGAVLEPARQSTSVSVTNKVRSNFDVPVSTLDWRISV